MNNVKTRISELSSHGGVAEKVLKQICRHQVPADSLYACVRMSICARVGVFVCVHAFMFGNRFHMLLYW